MTSVIIVICAAALVVFAVWRTAQKFLGKSKASCCGSAEAVSAKPVEDMDESHYPYHYKLTVSDMACSNCARNVENALNSVDGVWARVNLGRKEADVLSKQEHTKDDFANALSQTQYKVTNCVQAAG